LVVGAARSGTTLLRVILDSHPEIGCPPEAGIPALIQHLGRVWFHLGTHLDAGDEVGGISDEAANAIRRCIDEIMTAYCRVDGKRVYCDKSLDSGFGLDAVQRVFPGTKSIMVARHMMDVIASGLEASPWGFESYGYTPYVQASPDNVVAALAEHWNAHIERATEWGSSHPNLCMSVRYEDLVEDPSSVSARVFAFLEVAEHPLNETEAVLRARKAEGPGDHKIVFTDAIHRNSVGRGRAVPVKRLPLPLLERSNRNLRLLGYEEVTQSWNSESHTPARLSSEDAHATLIVTRVMTAAASSLLFPASTDVPFAILVDDDPTARWIINPGAGTIIRGEGDVEFAIAAPAQDLLALARGEVNVGVALRAGRLRHISADDDAGLGDLANRIMPIFRWLAEAQATLLVD
jgi:hypothetical protein